MKITLEEYYYLEKQQLTYLEVTYLRLRIEPLALTYDQIGSLFGISKQAVHKVVTSAKKKLEAQGVDPTSLPD